MIFFGFQFIFYFFSYDFSATKLISSYYLALVEDLTVRFLRLQDEIGCSSSTMASGALASEGASYSGSTRATKQRRIADANKPERHREESRSTAIISSLRRLQNDRIVDDDDAAAAVLGICKLSRDHSR